MVKFPMGEVAKAKKAKKTKTELDYNPSAENPLCIKCGFHEACRHPFTGGIWVDSEGSNRTGIPDGDNSHMIAFLGDPLDLLSESNAESGGAWRSKPGVRFFKILDEFLPDKIESFWYHPVTKCRPMEFVTWEDDPTKEISQETKLTLPKAKRCWHLIERDIAKIRPKAIITSSPQILKFLTGYGDIGVAAWKRYTGHYNTASGEKIEVPVFATIPLFDVLKDRKRLGPIFGEKLKDIINRIENPVSYAYVKKSGLIDFTLAREPETIRKWFSGLTYDIYNPLSWDVETKGLKVWDKGFKVGVFSFSHPARKKPLIVVNDDYLYFKQLTGTQTDSSARELSGALMAEIKTVLENPDILKIGHNLGFDTKAVFARFKITVEGFLNDTLLMAYVLNASSQGGRRLEDLIREFLPGVPEYWTGMDDFTAENPGIAYDYTSYPPDKVLPYAAYDTMTVSHLYSEMLKNYQKRIEEGFGGWFVVSDEEPRVEGYNLIQYSFYVRSLHHRLCSHMEIQGLQVDMSIFQTIATHYRQEFDRLIGDLNGHEKVTTFRKEKLPECFKEGSPQRKKLEREIEKGNLPEINWGSPKQVSTFLFDYMEYEPVGLTATGTPTTNDAALSTLVAKTQCPIVATLGELRGFQKFLSSFIDPLERTGDDPKKARILHDGNKLHAQFQTSSARTGRLSCKDPNLQQLPREGLVKKLYISSHKGGWLYQRDYSGLEVRILACVSRDARLVDDFLNGRDPHFRTQQYFFKEKADKHNKTQRSICKQVLFGRVYGQTAIGLYSLLRAKQVQSPFTGLPVTLEECEQFNSMIDELYPGVEEWVTFAHAQATENAWVCSPFGFVRPLPAMASYEHYEEERNLRNRSKEFGFLRSEINAAFRQAQNTPIQSAASDLTVAAGWEVLRRFKEAKLKSTVCSLVHDSIWTDVAHDDEMLDVARIMHDVMDRSQEWLPELLPGFDTSWMVVPIIGEVEMGVNAKDTVTSCEEPTDLDTSKKLIFDIPKDWQEILGEKLEWNEGRKELRNFLDMKHAVI